MNISGCVGLIYYNNKIISHDYLWKKYSDYIFFNNNIEKLNITFTTNEYNNRNTECILLCRYKQEKDLKLIICSSGHLLLCQEDHLVPTFEKDIKKLFINKEAYFLNIDDRLKINSSNNINTLRSHVSILNMNLNDITRLEEIIFNDEYNDYRNILFGDNINNFTLSNDFIFYDKKFLKEFLYMMFKNINIKILDINFIRLLSENIDLLQQLKIIAEILEYDLYYTFNKKENFLLIEDIYYNSRNTNRFEGGLIKINDIITINDYSKYIYGLQTKSGYYNLNNIYNHNCRIL